MAHPPPTRDCRWLASRAVAPILLSLYWVLAVSAKLDKCSTADELAHVTAGFSYWETGDMRLQPENGVLPQRWMGLPLYLAGQCRFPPLDSEDWRISHVWRVGAEFFYQMGNEPDAMLLVARASIALFSVAVGVLVYVWSCALFGTTGAAVSLLLFVLSPTMLSHGALATSDAAATLFFLAAVGGIWSVLDRLSWQRLLASSLATACLFLSKMSAPLILPMFGLLAAARVWRGRPLPVRLGCGLRLTRRRDIAAACGAVLLVHLLVSWALIWGAFGLRFPASRAGGEAREQVQLFPGGWDGVLADRGVTESAVGLARDHRVLPEAYLFGFMQAMKFSRRRDAFLNGEVRDTGWRRFFPYCVLVKTPLGFLAVLVLAAAAVPRVWPVRVPTRAIGRRRLLAGVYKTWPLWVLTGVYWGAAIPCRLNLGLRHIMPTYPAMFILAGAAGRWVGRRPKVMERILAACLAWGAVESFRIRPHYLAYFNQIVGGPRNGYRHLVDSSLDWGQDVPGLKRWLTDQEALSGRTDVPVYLWYFGNGLPSYYGIRAKRLPPFLNTGGCERSEVHPPLDPLRPGIFCVSATMLQCVYWRSARRWSGEAERRYRAYLALVNEYRNGREREGHAPALQRFRQGAGEDQWQNVVIEYGYLRQTRLFSYLRRREPDDHVGYSILIYLLPADELHRALFGPPEFDE